MINHPMLLPRDPPPEIDVTRPALRVRADWPSAARIAVDYAYEADKTVMMTYMVDSGAITVQAITEFTGCTRSHPHENMSAACERKTVAALAAFIAAQNPIKVRP